MAAPVPYIVNQSTTLVQFDTSDIALSPRIALLSSVNAPGSLITIRDLTGNASATNQIIVSTMQGQSFLNGNNLSSYTITQPYGFLTITPKTTQGWALLNTFAFPDASAAANINTINSVSMATSSLEAINASISTAAISSLSVNNIYLQQNISVGQSTISRAGFFQCTLRAMENMFVANTLFVGSTISTVTANVTSTLIVPYISAIKLDIRGVITTASTISTNGPLFVGSSISTTANLAVGGSTFIQGELRVQQNATFFSSVSTLYALNVGRETQLNSTLSVRDDALLYRNLSTVLNLNVGGAVSINSNLNVMGSTILNKTLLTFGEISSLSNVFINRNLSVVGDIAVGGNLNFGSTVRFSNIIASSLFANFFISTPSSIAVGTSLNVLGSTVLTGPVSTLSNLNVVGAFNLQRAATLNSTLTVVSSISTTGNLTASGIISTLSSVVVGDSLTVARSGLFGNNISTLSSLGVGRSVSIEGTLFVRSTISAIGSAAFYSSVQIQGSVSIFSSLAVAGSTFMQKVGIGGNIPTLASDPSGNSVLKVTGDLQLTGDLRDALGNRIALTTAGGSPIPGINSAGNIGINRASNASYQFDVSGATIIRGQLDVSGQATFTNSSNTGTLGIAGATTLNTLSTTGNVGLGVAPGAVRLSVTGDQSNVGNLNVRGSLYVYSSGGLPEIRSAGNIISDYDMSVARNLTVGSASAGITTLVNSSHDSFVINGGVNVNSKGISFYPTFGTNTSVNSSPWYGIGFGTKLLGGRLINSVQLAGYAGINFVSGGPNESYGSDMAIVNNRVGIANINPSHPLDVSGNTRITGNVGIGKAPTANALDVSGNVYATKFVGDLSGSSIPTAGINSAGNVGINKASDATYELDVSGDLRATGLGLFVNTSNTGTLGVTSLTTLNTLNVTGATNFSNSLTVASGNAATFNGTLTITGNIRTQGTNALSFGNSAAQTSQGQAAIAIGCNAGNASQGANAIAIGNQAGPTSQAANSIILNASGTALDNASQQGLFIKPIRNATASFTLKYNTATSEISYVPDTTIVADSLSIVNYTISPIIYNSSLITSTIRSRNIVTDSIISVSSLIQNMYSPFIYNSSLQTSSVLTSTVIVAGQATLTGNVGIGKAPTGNPLDVSGNAYATKFVGDLSGNATSATFALSPTAGINSSGNVGINRASNASFQVDVNGTMNVSGLATFTNTSNTGTLGVAGAATFGNTSNTGTLGVAGAATFGNTSNTGTLGVAGTSRFTGNVGIGKAATANPLDVSGNAFATKFVGDLSGNATTASRASIATYAETSGGASIAGINTPGSIGINTISNASFALDVGGTMNVSGNVNLRSAGGGTIIVGVSGQATAMTLYGTLNVSNNVSFCTAGAGTVTVGVSGQTTAMTVNGTLGVTGRTAINKTTATTYALEVNGDVQATYFRGDGSLLTNLPASSGIAGIYSTSYGGTPPVPSIIINRNPANDAKYTLADARLFVEGNMNIDGDARLRTSGEGQIIIGSDGYNNPTLVDIYGTIGVFPNISDTSYRVPITDRASSRLAILMKNNSAGKTMIEIGSYNGDAMNTANSVFRYKMGYVAGNFIIQAVPVDGTNYTTIGTITDAMTIIGTSGNMTIRGTLTQNSDLRIKENIVTIDSALDKIMKLRGVYYTRKDISIQRQIGIIAQEIEEILPEVVLTDNSEEKIKSVAYGNITALLIEGMKEQKRIIDSQQKTIEAQQSTINYILTRI